MPPSIPAPTAAAQSLPTPNSIISYYNHDASALLLRLVVLQSAAEGCEYQEDDSPADVAQHFARAAGSTTDVVIENVILTPENYAQQLVQLARRFEQKEIDCFINLCDGAWDEPSCGIQVVDLLENKLNLPFTGADTAFFEPTRLQMKKACLACGVKVPNWRFVYNAGDLDRLLAEFTTDGDDDDDANVAKPLQFPLLVKHFSSYSSVGLTKESKVWDVAGLQLQ